MTLHIWATIFNVLIKMSIIFFKKAEKLFLQKNQSLIGVFRYNLTKSGYDAKIITVLNCKIVEGLSCDRSHSRCDFSERMANKGSCRLVQRFVTASILGETRVERVEKLDTGCGWVVIWQAVFRTACRIIAKLH